MLSLANLKYPNININLPETKSFSIEYALWRKENLHPELNLYVEYPEEMQEVNRVLKSDMIDVIMHQPYLEDKNSSPVSRKQYYVDTEEMQKEFAKKLENT